MGLAVQRISTVGVPEGARAGYWSNLLRDMVGNVEASPIGGTMEGRIDMVKLGRIVVAQVHGCNTRLVMPSAQTSSPRMPSLHLLFQQHGNSTFEQDGQLIPIKPGDCLAYDFERAHRISVPDVNKLFSLRIPRELLQINGFRPQRMKAAMLTRDAMLDIACELLQSVIERVEAIDAESHTAVADALVRFLVPCLIRDAGSMSRMTSAQTLVTRARNYIESNLGDPDLDVDHIARVMGCTRRYLHMAFAGESTTVSKMIWSMRLERARHMIESNPWLDHSMTDIAFACGFSSSAHFSRTFRERFGVTPSNMRCKAAPLNECSATLPLVGLVHAA
jgi:AraC-like DNA-binding protein